MVTYIFFWQRLTANFGESFRLPSSSTTSIRAECLASTPECPASGGGWEHLGILNHFLTTEILGKNMWSGLNWIIQWDSGIHYVGVRELALV